MSIKTFTVEQAEARTGRLIGEYLGDVRRGLALHRYGRGLCVVSAHYTISPVLSEADRERIAELTA